LLFDEDYPFIPPKVKFITKMFHPNIEENGMLASGALFDKWDSQYDMIIVFYAIENIL
jgi:ubiquitin-protein ligase